MVQLTLFVIIIVLFSSSTVVSPVITYPAIYVFGDSWSDDNGVLSSWKQFNLPWSPPELYRWSNGPTYTYYLAKMLLTNPNACDWSLDTTELGVSNCDNYINLAVGGACTHNWEDPALDPECGLTAPHPNSTFKYSSTFVDQAAYFAQMNLVSVSQGLAIILIGANDFNAIVAFAGSFLDNLDSILVRSDDILDSISQSMQVLYNAGVRNFLYINLPSVLVSPRGIVDTADPVYRELVDLFIGHYLNNLQVQINRNFGLSGVEITYANLWGCMRQLSAGYYSGFSGLGFNLTTTQCVANRSDINSTICPSPNNAVFWDDIHPTTAWHKVLAGMYYSLLQGNTSGCMSTNCIETSLFTKCFSGGERDQQVGWSLLLMIVMVAMVFVLL